MRTSIFAIPFLLLSSLAWAGDAPPKKAGPLPIAGDQISLPAPVAFQSRKAVILEESRWLLDSVAATVEIHPEICGLEIGVHTDSRGSGAYNKKMTQERADAVRSVLIQKGVPRAVLTAVGHGEDRPIASNRTAAGREKNRRVEFTITKRCPKK